MATTLYQLEYVLKDEATDEFNNSGVYSQVFAEVGDLIRAYPQFNWTWSVARNEMTGVVRNRGFVRYVYIKELTLVDSVV